MRNLITTLVCVILLIVSLSGCSNKVPGVPNTVVKVNDEAIPASVYLDQVSRRFGEDVLRNLIEQRTHHCSVGV